MKYSVATISLPTMTPPEVVEAVSAAGYAGVEWKVGEAPHAMTSSASSFLQGNRSTLTPGVTDGAALRRMCDSAGLTVVGLGPYLTIGDEAALREVVALAQDMGAPQIRIQAARTSRTAAFDYRDLARSTSDYLAVAERVARAAGLRVVLEMHHHTVAPSAALARELVSRLDPEVVGVIYDVGNAVWEGFENPRMAVEILGPYLHHVHLKNVAATPRGDGAPWTYVWAPLEDGLVDVAGTCELLREIGYAGWISLEDLSTVRDPLGTLRHNAELLSGMPQARWRDDT